MKPSPGALFLVAAAITLSSCEYVYTYTFELRNASSDTVVVLIERSEGRDTVLVAGELAMTLFADELGIEGPHGPYPHRVSEFMESMRIIDRDQVTSRRDYMDDGAWFFHKGTYTAYVTDAEFE